MKYGEPAWPGAKTWTNIDVGGGGLDQIGIAEYSEYGFIGAIGLTINSEQSRAFTEKQALEIVDVLLNLVAESRRKK